MKQNSITHPTHEVSVFVFRAWTALKTDRVSEQGFQVLSSASAAAHRHKLTDSCMGT